MSKLNTIMPGRIPRHLPGPKQQRGQTLIEVLVTVIVMSLGMLGMAGLQVSALQGNHQAHLDTVAANQIQDMAARIRANPAGVNTDSYDALGTSIPTPGKNCYSASCTPGELAVFDHAQWNTANANLLPGGAGRVTDTGGNNYWIAVLWTDKSLDGSNGWATGTDAATACGTPAANTRCYYVKAQS